MEIDEAVRKSSDRRLITKYENSIYVIQRAFALYEFEEVAFSFNGGKDSTVLLHLLRAGYFLHKEKMSSANTPQTNGRLGCPIRTIYFESLSAFPEINSFTYETASTYDLQMEIIRLDFKSGLEALLKENPIKAIFLGTRIGDPNAIGQEQFSPSSPGWPPFMRVNPILDWSYRDVWAFLLTCKVQYCSLYDQGYTSIGSIYDTVPNALLCVTESSNSKENFRPAYLLPDGRLERAGRAKKISPPTSESGHIKGNGFSMDPHQSSTRTASIILVGDEILFGTVEDHLSSTLCKKLHSIGWAVKHVAIVRNDIDSVAEEVEKRKASNDMVFIFGGVGPIHSDVTVSGVAKAFGVRLAPDEEFEEHLRQLIGDQCTGDRNEMALLPEGVTELLHHEMLPVPLIKCENVVIFSATNISELEQEWKCLLELTSSCSPLALMTPFVSKHLQIPLSDVKIAGTLSKFCLEFPDLYIGCYRESRIGPLVICFRGKSQVRVDIAVEKLRQKFPYVDISEVKDANMRRILWLLGWGKLISAHALTQTTITLPEDTRKQFVLWMLLCNCGENAIEWLPEERITLFTTDGLLQIGGSLIPRRISSSEKKQGAGKGSQRFQRFRETDYMDPGQGLCLGALFDIAATNGLDMGRRLCIFGFCRSIEMLSDVVEDTVLEHGGEVVAAEKASEGGLQEKLTMSVVVPLLWGVPPASETLGFAVRSGGGIVEKVYWQWDFL